MALILNPKERFIADSRAADAHGELCRSPHFIRACEVAWAEFTLKQQTADATTGLRIDGAREFLKTLLNIGEPITPTRNKLPDQLTPV